MVYIQLLLVALLLMCSAFFSSSETALFSLSSSQLEGMRRKRKGSYAQIMNLLNEPRRLIVTILLGNEFANLLLSSIMASIIIQLYGEDKSYYNILVATPLLLFFGEITPKALAIRNNESFAGVQAPLLHGFARLITPVRVLVRSISDKLTTLLVGRQRDKSNLISEDMVITLAQEAVGEGTLERLEAYYINQVFKFGDAKADDAMVPRSNMQFIRHDCSASEVISAIRNHERDKLVIYRKQQDEVVGLLYARDLLTLRPRRKQPENWLEKLARKPMLVPESRSLLDLFHQMRSQKISVALVIDEYGGITGQVSLQDVLEFIFGDVPNEKQKKAGPIKKVRLPGSMKVAQFNQKYHTNLDTGKGDTLNGLLMHQFGELPSPRVCMTIGDVNFTILKVERNRITEVMAQAASSSRRFLGDKIKAATKKTAKTLHNAAKGRKKSTAPETQEAQPITLETKKTTRPSAAAKKHNTTRARAKPAISGKASQRQAKGKTTTRQGKTKTTAPASAQSATAAKKRATSRRAGKPGKASS